MLAASRSDGKAGYVEYFSKNPQYHMYLHPDRPAYEKHIEARDRMLEMQEEFIYAIHKSYEK